MATYALNHHRTEARGEGLAGPQAHPGPERHSHSGGRATTPSPPGLPSCVTHFTDADSRARKSGNPPESHLGALSSREDPPGLRPGHVMVGPCSARPTEGADARCAQSGFLQILRPG